MIASSTSFRPVDLQKIFLKEGESFNVEPSAMLACKNVEMKTDLNGSISAVAKRYLFGGETIFQNTYTAKKGEGWIALEETIPGQISAYELKPGESLSIAKSAYVASDQNVKISTNYAGVASWWKGLSIVKLTAVTTDGKNGRVFFNSEEGIIKAIEVKGNEGPTIVDNNHLVAYTSGLQVSIRKIGGLKSLLFSGEGTVNEVIGNGWVFVGSATTRKITRATSQSNSSTPLALTGGIISFGIAVAIASYSPSFANTIAAALANATCDIV